MSQSHSRKRPKLSAHVSLDVAVGHMQLSLQNAAPDLESLLPGNAHSATDIMMAIRADEFAKTTQKTDNTTLTYTSRLKSFVAAVYLLSQTPEFSQGDLLKFISRDWLAEFTFPLSFLKIVFRYMYELPFTCGNQRTIREYDKDGNECRPNFLPNSSIQPLGLSFSHADGLKSALCWVLGDKKDELYQDVKNSDGKIIGVKGNALRERSMLDLLKHLKNDWKLGGVSRWQAKPIEFSTLLKLWDAVEELQHLRDYTIIIVAIALGCRKAILPLLRVEDIMPAQDSDGNTICGRGQLAIYLDFKIPQLQHEPAVIQSVHMNSGTEPNLCPVRAIYRWLALSDIQSGYLFRSVYHLAKPDKKPNQNILDDALRRLYKRAGQDFTDISPHSTRRTAIHWARRSKATLDQMMQFSRHTSLAGILPYVAEADARGLEAQAKHGVDDEPVMWVWKPVRRTTAANEATMTMTMTRRERGRRKCVADLL